MKFLYFLDNSAGWAGVIFEHDKTSLNYSVSYCLSENIKELMGGLILLTVTDGNYNKFINDLDDKIEVKDNEFKWTVNEEGSIATFKIKKIENTSLINLCISEDQFDSNGKKIVFNGDVDLIEFIDCILYSCSDMLNKYGILGYYFNFWEEFPIYEYLLLKNYREGKIIFDSFSEINNDCEQDMNRSKLEIEMNYLYSNQKQLFTPWEKHS